MRTLLLGLLLFILPGYTAARLSVLVVTSDPGSAHEEVLSGLYQALGDVPDDRLHLRTVNVRDFDSARTGPQAEEHLDLVVTVGAGAARSFVNFKPTVPVLCSFLPQSVFNALASENRGRPARLFALYLDQPFDRQLRLIRLAMPEHTRVGVVLGPESSKYEDKLQSAASTVGVKLQIERISDEKQLIRALHLALEDTDILLAVPDPLVFNRNTAQSVLLTTYRLGKPVAGYSHAYVQAGALFSVYSTPAQIGRQLGMTLLKLEAKPGSPPVTTAYPAYFSVAVNDRVARSFGLTIGDAMDLSQRLAEPGRDKHP